MRDNRFCENRMELTCGDRQIDNVGNGGSKDRSTYFQKPGGDRIGVRLLVRTVEKNLRYFRLRCRPERRKTERFSRRGGECGDEVEVLVREV